MFILIVALFLVIGVIAGFLSSIFGIGGGLLIVPVMYIYLKLLHVNGAILMHIAVGTSLLSVLFTTCNAMILHTRANNILWPQVRQLLPAVVAGAIVGAVLSEYLHSEVLRYLFMVFILWIIIQSRLSGTFQQEYTLQDVVPIKRAVGRCVGFTIGVISVLVGIGGSAMVIPFLRQHHLPMRSATGTTVVIALSVSVIGSFIYMATGWHALGLPPYSIGFVNLPAFFGIATGSFVGVPLGMKMVKKLPDRHYASLYLLILVLMLLTMVAA